MALRNHTANNDKQTHSVPATGVEAAFRLATFVLRITSEMSTVGASEPFDNANARTPKHAHNYSLRGSNPRPMAHKTIALTTELREPTTYPVTHKPKTQPPSHNDPGRTRTCNPRLRGPMPYPLGHGAVNTHQRYCKQTQAHPKTTTQTQQPNDTNPVNNRDTQQTHAIETSAAQGERNQLPL